VWYDRPKYDEGQSAVAKLKAIVNQYDGPRPPVDKYEAKYFKYLGTLRETGADIIAAFGSHDIAQIKQAITSISNSINNHVVLIGLACVIIDREQVYIDAGYKSYLDFVPVVVEAYDEREAHALRNRIAALLKEIRASR
jgi:hypothetical protein